MGTSIPKYGGLMKRCRQKKRAERDKLIHSTILISLLSNNINEQTRICTLRSLLNEYYGANIFSFITVKGKKSKKFN